MLQTDSYGWKTEKLVALKEKYLVAFLRLLENMEYEMNTAIH